MITRPGGASVAACAEDCSEDCAADCAEGFAGFARAGSAAEDCAGDCAGDSAGSAEAKFAEEDCVLFALVCALAKLTYAQGQVFAVWPRPRQWLHVKIVFEPSVCTVGGFFCFQPHNTGLINSNHADVYARV